MCKRSFKNEITNWIEMKVRIMRRKQRLVMHKILQKLMSPWDKVGPEKNRSIDFSPRATKGQLISEWSFGVFKSPKKPTKFLTDFCPMKLGHKSVKKLVYFLGDLKAQKFHSEINWLSSKLPEYNTNYRQTKSTSNKRTHPGKSENLFSKKDKKN